MVSKFISQKLASQVILSFVLLSQVLAFQNCGQGFEAQNALSLSSSAILPVCSPTQSQSCETAAGYGIQFCSEEGAPLTCQIESCKSGYALEQGACLPVSCIAGAMASCSENNGSGNKTCNSTGTGYGACILNACDSGYNLQNEMCVANVCQPSTQASCAAGNGMGTYTCNAQGTGYGACMLSSCNSGFNLQNGNCVANACMPGAQASCTQNNGTGNKTCNSTGTGFGACVLNACDAGYNLQNGVCVANLCSPGTPSSCSAGNGMGTQVCNAQGTGYGACTLSSCNPGFNLQNGQCVANLCTPSTTTACSENNGIGSKACNSVGTGFGACVLNACSAGYNLQNGVCVANLCSPGTPSSCSAGNGMGTQVCNAQGTGYGACALSSCNPGYNLQNGQCVPNACTPNAKLSCYESFGIGYKTCNASGTAYGSCQIESCSSSYIFKGGVCVYAHTIIQVSASYSNLCFLTAAGKVKCISNSSYYGDDMGVTETSLAQLNGAVQIAVSSNHSICALMPDTRVKCFGYGRTADGKGSSPLVDIGLSGVKKISSNCAITSDGQIMCWKLPAYHLKVAMPGTPVLIGGISGARDVSSDNISVYNGNCAVESSGRVLSWADNQPLRVEGAVAGAKLVAINNWSMCVVTDSGAVKCKGGNYNGQLGNGTSYDSAIFGDTVGLSSVAKISAGGGGGTFCASTNDGTAKCWGDGSWGVLGNQKSQESSVPLAIIGIGPVKDVSVGGAYACVGADETKLICWGDLYGFLKVGTNVSPPTEVPWSAN